MVMAYAQEDANNDMQVSEHKHKGYGYGGYGYGGYGYEYPSYGYPSYSYPSYGYYGKGYKGIYICKTNFRQTKSIQMYTTKSGYGKGYGYYGGYY